MTIVNFYQLDASIQRDDKINKLICDLILEHYNNKKNIYVLCINQEQCYRLDEYIINYQEYNFFPYQILESQAPDENNNLLPPAKICIGTDLVPKLKPEILINLHENIPSNFLKYKLIIEIVIALNQSDTHNSTDNDILKKREHYKYYQKHNCTNNYIKI